MSLISLREMITEVKSKQTNGRPMISDLTMKQYLSSLNKLHRFITGRDEILTMDWIYAKDKISDYIETNPTNKKPRSVSSKRNTLSYILTIFKFLKDETSEKYYSEKYIEQYNIINDKTNSTENNSLKQSEKIISMEKLNELISILKKNNLITEYLLFKLLKLYAMRNEVGTLILIDLKDYNLLKKKKQLTENYLVMGKHKLIISRSIYKTFKTYGMKEIIINDKVLRSELKDYVADKKMGDPVFVADNGRPFTSQMISTILSFVSNKYIGVALSTSSIFKIVIANFEGSPKEFKDFLMMKSKERGTDPSTLLDYYIYNLNDKTQK